MALSKPTASAKETAERYARLLNQCQRELREAIAVNRSIVCIWCIQTIVTLIWMYSIWGRG